jgi:predicted RNase H-like nuclease (RuvC/YqgF family)
MADCPNCGTNVAVAVKCWTVSPAKHTAKGDIPEFRVGIFECPECKKKFRSRVAPKAKSAEVTNVETLVANLKEIRQGLKQTLRVLREKMQTLETERSSVLVEVEKLKKVAETRASALEAEVNELREELKSLRELLGSSDERV